jgi:hypothetical protein
LDEANVRGDFAVPLGNEGSLTGSIVWALDTTGASKASEERTLASFTGQRHL